MSDEQVKTEEEPAAQDEQTVSPDGDMETASGQDASATQNAEAEKETVPEWRQEMEREGFKTEEDLMKGFKESRKGMTQAFMEKSASEKELADANRRTDLYRKFHNGQVNTEDIETFIKDDIAATRDEATKQEQKKAYDNVLVTQAKDIVRMKYPDIYTEENEALIDRLASAMEGDTPVEMLENAIGSVKSLQTKTLDNLTKMRETQGDMKKAADMESAAAKEGEPEKVDYANMPQAEFEARRDKALYG